VNTKSCSNRNIRLSVAGIALLATVSTAALAQSTSPTGTAPTTTTTTTTSTDVPPTTTVEAGVRLTAAPSNSDPSAPLSPTLKATTKQKPSPTSAAHTASEVLAYLITYDNLAIALARQGRDRRVDPQVRAYAGRMLANHQADIARVRALAAGTGTAIVETGDVKARTDLGGTDLDALARVTDANYAPRFLDAASELHQDALDLIDKRFTSDVADDPRMVEHLRATRGWVSAEKSDADRLRSSGK
jgi:predicted outer membrane protein